MPRTVTHFQTLLITLVLLVLVACAGPQPRHPGEEPDPVNRDLDPDNHAFGATSTGGLLLFARNGRYEIQRTDRNALPAEPLLVAAGDLGIGARLVGIASGRRHTTVLVQHADGEMRLHRLGQGALDPVSLPLTTQNPRDHQNFRARNLALSLPNPKVCLEGDAEFLALMEAVPDTGLQDEVWYIGEDGHVTRRYVLTRPSGWTPVAVGTGAVENSSPWVLLAHDDMRRARLVMGREQGLTLLLDNTPEVSFIPLDSALVSETGPATAFAFAPTIRAASQPYWWHIYVWDTYYLFNPVAGQDNPPPDRDLAVVVGSPPAGLDFVGYADRRPLCLNWRTLPYPPKLREQRRYWEELEGAIEALRPGSRINLEPGG